MPLEINPTRPQIFPGDVYNIDFRIAQSVWDTRTVAGWVAWGMNDKWV
jgi:hypothetical protein